MTPEATSPHTRLTYTSLQELSLTPTFASDFITQFVTEIFLNPPFDSVPVLRAEACEDNMQFVMVTFSQIISFVDFSTMASS